jgi:hypothetical protein
MKIARSLILGTSKRLLKKTKTKIGIKGLLQGKKMFLLGMMELTKVFYTGYMQPHGHENNQMVTKAANYVRMWGQDLASRWE